MNGYQTSALALAGSVALVSLWRDNHLQNIWGVISTNHGPGGLAGNFQADAKPLGIDVLGVAIITFVAGLSDDAGKLMIALSVGLWLLYLMSGGAHSPHQAGANLVQAATDAANQYIQQKGA